MKRLLLFALFAALFAWPALAVNDGSYPQTILDDTCTDSNDTPAAQTGGWVRPPVQASGSADGFCDHDSRIRETALTASTEFGPFTLPNGTRGVVLIVDANVVSNDTDTWRPALSFMIPATQSTTTLALGASTATEAVHYFSFAPGEYATPAIVGVANVDVAVPRRFYINLNLQTATSWEGIISWYAY